MQQKKEQDRLYEKLVFHLQNVPTIQLLLKINLQGLRLEYFSHYKKECMNHEYTKKYTLLTNSNICDIPKEINRQMINKTISNTYKS